MQTSYGRLNEKYFQKAGELGCLVPFYPVWGNYVTFSRWHLAGGSTPSWRKYATVGRLEGLQPCPIPACSLCFLCVDGNGISQTSCSHCHACLLPCLSQHLGLYLPAQAKRRLSSRSCFCKQQQETSSKLKSRPLSFYTGKIQNKIHCKDILKGIASPILW